MHTYTDRGGLIAGIGLAAMAALIPLLILRYFDGVLLTFGAHLPLLTRVFMHHGYLLWLLPAGVLVAWLAWPHRRQRGGLAVSLGLAALIAMVPLTVIAVYLPIFKLAAAV